MPEHRLSPLTHERSVLDFAGCIEAQWQKFGAGGRAAALAALPGSPLSPMPSDWRSTASTKLTTLLMRQDTLTVSILPYTGTLLSHAIASGHPATIKYVLGRYRQWYPECLVPQYRTPDGFWRPRPGPCQATSSTSFAGVTAERICMQPVFQYRDLTTNAWQVSADGRDVKAAAKSGAQIYVAFSPSHAMASGLDGDTLRLLYDEGAADISLSAPPCQNPMKLQVPEHLRMQLQELQLRQVSMVPARDVLSARPTLGGVEGLVVLEDPTHPPPVGVGGHFEGFGPAKARVGFPYFAFGSRWAVGG